MSPADVLDEPIPFEWDDPKRGRLRLLVCPMTFGMEAAVQRALEDRALKAVQRHREAMSLADYQVNMDGWRRDCAAGVYEYGGLASFQWMCTASGWCFRAQTMLRVDDENRTLVTLEMAERIAVDPKKREELSLKIELANDPGRRRPAPVQGASAPPGGSPSPTPSPASPASRGAVPATTSAG